MTREARTVFLGILTLAVYAFGIFTSAGAVIFPFPLNEFIFLVVAVRLLMFNWEGSKLVGFFPVVLGICGVLGTQFFWSFFLGQMEMMEFTKGLTIDYFSLAFHLLILIAGIATMVKQKSGLALILTGLSLVAFISGIFLYETLLILLAYASMVVSTQIKKVFEPYHLLWILLFALKLTEWLTFFLNS